MFTFLYSILYKQYGKPSYTRINAIETKLAQFSLIEFCVMEIIAIGICIYLMFR